MSYGRFDKMVAIPEEEYMQLKKIQPSKDPMQPVKDPMMGKFLTLSNDYKKQSNIMNPYIRNQRQGETLTQMMNVKDALRQRTLSATPRIYQSRAQSLFQFVADKLNMNERGELLTMDGSVIEGSNIADLIQHSVRDRRRNIVPAGWSEFLQTLQANNVPRMILNYDTLSELNQSRTPARHPTKWIYTPPPPKSSNKAKAKVERKSSSTRKRPIRTKREPNYLKDYRTSTPKDKSKREPPYLKDFLIDSPKTPVKKRRKYL